jgi:hypothetical protein
VIDIPSTLPYGVHGTLRDIRTPFFFFAVGVSIFQGCLYPAYQLFQKVPRESLEHRDMTVRRMRKSFPKLLSRQGRVKR